MKKNTNNTEVRRLSEVKGTVAFVLSHELNTIVYKFERDTFSLDECKHESIILINTAQKCKSRDKIVNTIERINTKDSLLQYLYNLILAGDNMSVLK